MSLRLLHPSSAMLVVSSLRIMCRARCTPAWPPTASANSSGRPMPTAVAPNARALMTSVPRVKPPSTSTGTRPSTRRTMPSSTSIGAGAKSSWRPPWLDTMMPSTPWSSASAASSWHSSPLTRMGSLQMDCSQGMRLHLGVPCTSSATECMPEPALLLKCAFCSRSRFQTCSPGGNRNRFFSSASRFPILGASTVSTIALYPSSSASVTMSRTTLLSLKG
mmetsp:Transcript_27216/g.70621  ORF Transcript_27216/g.70621 Transcript_27216/m.70621 type:complete len:220 (+) Transcript_27216:297-956(+)